MKRLILILILIMIASLTHAQYQHEVVLEKSFERADFFFAPSTVNPFGIGGFGKSMLGLVDDPLLNVQVNPAYPAADSTGSFYSYLNFRNSREIKDNESGQPWFSPLSSRMDYMIYPYYYTTSRTALEPIISGAFFYRPGGSEGRFVMGASYQMIMVDEPYYNVPQDIYKSNLEMDFAGNRIAESSDIPVIDRYSGADEMHQEGHFGNVYASVLLTSRLSAGIRLGLTSFTRDGSMGSQNYWESSYHYHGSSSWANMTHRDQSYTHKDFSAGLLYKIDESSFIGISGGALWGDVDQSIARENGSQYHYGTVNETDDWSVYERQAYEDQSWNHEGQSWYGSIHLEKRVGKGQILTAGYQFIRENVDLTSASVIEDTSYSNYYHRNDDWYYASESWSKMHDSRTGSGSRKGNTHRFRGGLRWHFDKRLVFHGGVSVDVKKRTTQTAEDVLFRGTSDYWWENTDGRNTNFNDLDESKTLYWDFNASVTTVRIPVYMTYQISRAIQLSFGIQRKMQRWHITDVTDAYITYRDQTFNETREKKENFIERYTQPEEKRTDITTTVLAGLTISPSKKLDVRFLAVPNFTKTYEGTEFSEFQWWIDFCLKSN